jgi:hypothetical protein
VLKDAVSLLDDFEILNFPSQEKRQAAIDRLAALGITEIRGVPVADRFRWTNQSSPAAAFTKIKAAQAAWWAAA